MVMTRKGTSPLPPPPPSQLWIRSKPGEVIGPNAFRKMDGEGMPIRQMGGIPVSQSNARGRLFIRFTVDFPRQLHLT